MGIQRNWTEQSLTPVYSTPVYEWRVQENDSVYVLEDPHNTFTQTAPAGTRLQANDSEASVVLDKALSLVPKMFTEESGLKYKLC